MSGAEEDWFSPDDTLDFSSQVVVLKQTPLGINVEPQHSGASGPEQAADLPRRSNRTRKLSLKGMEAALAEAEEALRKVEKKAISTLQTNLDIIKKEGDPPSTHRRECVRTDLKNAVHYQEDRDKRIRRLRHEFGDEICEKYLQTKAAHDRKFRQMYDLLEAWLQKTEPIAANSSTVTGTEENNIKSNPSQQKQNVEVVDQDNKSNASSKHSSGSASATAFILMLKEKAALEEKAKSAELELEENELQLEIAKLEAQKKRINALKKKEDAARETKVMLN